MHEDIQKLINIAKGSGNLTEKQKEIILRKAEKLGEDVDEVEMILETVRPNRIEIHSPKANDNRMRCPNCGSLLPGRVSQCPECGYVFSNVEVDRPDSVNKSYPKFWDDLANVLES